MDHLVSTVGASILDGIRLLSNFTFKLIHLLFPSYWSQLNSKFNIAKYDINETKNFSILNTFLNRCASHFKMRISPKFFHHDNKQPLKGTQKNSSKNSSQKNFRPYSPFMVNSTMSLEIHFMIILSIFDQYGLIWAGMAMVGHFSKTIKSLILHDFTQLDYLMGLKMVKPF